jgi:CRISPR/Cas system-associated protein Cas10 (large subunit of type III CRISPR-Cas system)
MTSEELASVIGQTIESVKHRILNVGDQQYSFGDKQKIETKTINEVLVDALEEVDDLLVYNSVIRIRVDQLRNGLDEHNPI